MSVFQMKKKKREKYEKFAEKFPEMRYPDLNLFQVSNMTRTMVSLTFIFCIILVIFFFIFAVLILKNRNRYLFIMPVATWNSMWCWKIFHRLHCIRYSVFGICCVFWVLLLVFFSLSFHKASFSFNSSERWIHQRW